MRLAWDAVRMRTGVDSVDRQHRRMIRMVNRLLDGIEADRSRTALARILASLSGEASAHFQHEEAVMCAARCRVRGANRVAHRCFLREYAHLVRAFAQDWAGPLFVAEVEQLCCEWLGDHIRQVDARLAECRKRGAGREESRS